MKVGSFLFGGLVGAAAVIYLNNKSKSMLFSAFTSNNQSVGNMMDRAKDKFNSAAGASAVSASDTKTRNKSNAAAASFKKEDAFSADGLGKVEDIIKQDPGLKVTVQEILASNSGNQDKEALQTQ
ncbi:MAG: hypothetical protein K0S39_2793 [Paenibacillus sp.]|jgi:trans-2-enoyl-CoA reductase|nr:hypothetical protein [Paenibacillus sp.]